MSTCKGLSENVCGVKDDCSVVVRGKTTYCRAKPKKRVAAIVAPAPPMVAPAPSVSPASPSPLPTPMPPASSVSPNSSVSSISSVSPIVSSSQESESEEEESDEEDSDEEDESESESESGIEESDMAESDVEDEECATNEFSKKCNTFKSKKELKEQQNITDNTYLYPTLNDPDFNVKIATKKEFNDTKYDGTIHADVKKQAEMLSTAEFELSPHQAFVKNFLSFQTPYNSLLLYHGLGSGKTCSAIGVSEEMRDYLKQMNHAKRIIIVASENVQENFRLQLFDERKLKEENGVWNITNCVGNKLLREINSTNLSRERIISEINSIIDNSYLFLGYIKFANYILKKAGSGDPKTQKERLKREFDNRLIIIDEVHNIRVTDTTTENKMVAIRLQLLVKSADNLRLLLLSATPMFNTYKEIIWLLNLMNMNDRRSMINHGDIFDKHGKFKEGGIETLTRKATGYVSFVRGENPYTFPYRVYPKDFSPENTFNKINKYPTIQMDGSEIKDKKQLKIINVFLGKIGSYQSLVYKYITNRIKNKKDALNITLGYTLLQRPLESLIMTYPHDQLTRDSDSSVSDSSASEASSASSEASSVSETSPEPSPEPSPIVSETSSVVSEPVSEPSPIISEPLSSASSSASSSSLVPEASPQASLFGMSSKSDTQVEEGELDQESVQGQEGELDQEPVQEPVQEPEEPSSQETEGQEEQPLQKQEEQLIPKEKEQTVQPENTSMPSYIENKEIIQTPTPPTPSSSLSSIANEEEQGEEQGEEQQEEPTPSSLTPASSLSSIENEEEEKEPTPTSLTPTTPPTPASSLSSIANEQEEEQEEEQEAEQEAEQEEAEEPTPSTPSSPVSSVENEELSSLSSSSDSKQSGGAIGINELSGKDGIERIMDIENRTNYEYKPQIEEKYGRIFSLEEIGKYSFKIESILKYILESKGIILIYSQFIDAGLIPMALALEELGFSKFDGKSLFKNSRPKLDVVTMQPFDKQSTKYAKYAMITGDSAL